MSFLFVYFKASTTLWFTACLLSLAVWGFFGAPPHRWVFHAIKVRKYCNKMGGQDCETADGGKGHLAGMAFEITLIFLIDYISKRWYLYDSPGFSPKLICLVGISLKSTLTWECSTELGPPIHLMSSISNIFLLWFSTYILYGEWLIQRMYHIL